MNVYKCKTKTTELEKKLKILISLEWMKTKFKVHCTSQSISKYFFVFQPVLSPSWSVVAWQHEMWDISSKVLPQNVIEPSHYFTPLCITHLSSSRFSVCDLSSPAFAKLSGFYMQKKHIKILSLIYFTGGKWQAAGA